MTRTGEDQPLIDSALESWLEESPAFNHETARLVVKMEWLKG